MLTREIALARLRTTGTLVSDAPARQAIALEKANSRITKEVASVLAADERARDSRWLAPAACQMVLA